MMNEIVERSCGLDVHQKSITACTITPEGSETKTFGAMTVDIIEMVEWIKSKKCTHVAMESTGVYWKPIYNILEAEDIVAMVVNAKHIKNVPGRKTDVKDAEWIAHLLKHGLLSASYIPDRGQRELRELVRYRRSMVQERTREISRLQKVLEGANIKLKGVVSNVLGVSARQMIEELIEDSDIEKDLKVIALLAKGRMKSKVAEIEKALKGTIGKHQRLLIRTQLNHIDFITEQIKNIENEIDRRLDDLKKSLDLMDTIPGIGKRTAQDIVAEIGTDMDRFPSDAHLSSWAGMSPGNNESAGKRKSGRTKKANKHLRSALVEAAKAAAKKKDSYLSAQYKRIAARRGKNRASVAVGHTILIIIYHILKTNKSYYELGTLYFDKLREDKIIRNTKRRMEQLGYEIEIKKKAIA